MKKILIFILACLLVAGLAACAARQQAQEQAAEDMAEDMLENMLGDDFNLEVDEGGNSVTIQDNSSGESVEFESSDSGAWPADVFPATVPEIKGVTITGSLSADDGSWVTFEDCDETEAKAYAEQMKSMGWETQMEMDMDGEMTISVTDGTNYLMLTYSKSDTSGMIMFGKNQ